LVPLSKGDTGYREKTPGVNKREITEQRSTEKRTRYQTIENESTWKDSSGCLHKDGEKAEYYLNLVGGPSKR